VTILRFADFEFDEIRAELRGADGAPVRLRPKPFAMLAVFVANAGRVVGKQELMAAVWPNVHVGEDSLFQCIREIRTALGDDERRLIRLVSGRGYLFDTEVRRAEPPAREPAQALPAATQAERRDPAPATPDATIPTPRRAPLRVRIAAVALVGLGAIMGITVAAAILRPGRLAPPTPTLAVAIVDAGNDAQSALMAANVSGDVVAGLAGIAGIGVVSAPATSADLVVRGRLQKDGAAWILRAEAVGGGGDVRWSTAVTVSGADTMLAQSRLAGGLGHELARYLNTLLRPAERADDREAAAHARIVVEQATAFINQTSRERFAAAQAMLEKALAVDPDNIDLAAALAAQLLRGIQTSWYVGAEGEAAERRAQALLERALRSEPRYLPVLETYCRFLTATNHFVESLVACAKALTFDPWNGLVRFNLGMSQAQLGRFAEAFETFKDADRFDTPTVSRWTWLLGAGLVLAMMDRDAEALAWLERSRAITPGTGRTDLVMAGAYERLGRHAEAKAALARGLALRPGSTAENVGLPLKNTSPLWREASERITRAEVAAGLPEH
jgi:DNA-binding winged helix-turn-helix (wHTH) protein/tetratricopeptide (TPR) repeat protein